MIDVFNTGRTPITVKRWSIRAEKNFAEWNFREAERSSISPYCRPEKSVSVCAYPLNSDVLL